MDEVADFDPAPPGYIVMQGGLMRCCLSTLDDLEMTGVARKADITYVVVCPHCKTTMKKEDGVWRLERLGDL